MISHIGVVWSVPCGAVTALGRTFQSVFLWATATVCLDFILWWKSRLALVLGSCSPRGLEDVLPSCAQSFSLPICYDSCGSSWNLLSRDMAGPPITPGTRKLWEAGFRTALPDAHLASCSGYRANLGALAATLQGVCDIGHSSALFPSMKTFEKRPGLGRGWACLLSACVAVGPMAN